MAAEGDAADDFTPADLFRHLQQRDSAIHDQISASREDVEAGLSLGAETEEQVTAIRQQLHLLTLEQHRNRALNQLNTQFNKLTTTGLLLYSLSTRYSALIEELWPITGSVNTAINEIHAADNAETFLEIVESSWDKVLDFLDRTFEATTTTH